METLDKQALQQLIHTLVSTHPELASTIDRVAESPSVKSQVDLVRSKKQDIIDNLPYKCDVESDYSYMRVKPYLSEFLSTVLDFILAVLPPMDVALSQACILLDEVTQMIHELPAFTNNEFQYSRNMAYEQIASSWQVLLAEGPASDLCKVIRETHLIANLEMHDSVAQGKFASVLEFARAELAASETRDTLPGGPSILSDLITMDYSNYSIAAHSST